MSTSPDVSPDRLVAGLEEEADAFEQQLNLQKNGKLDERVFAELRLRRGAYGQRYDNGQRHDGIESRQLPFPSGEATKGPKTLWDAPGMQRIKIPFGALTADQLDVLSDLAEEYSDSILHITTRQDVQLHFIHIEDTPNLMRRLGAVGITTKEACGNSVRNITGCPLAGVCGDEAFDISPYARGLTEFLLGHPDAQSFGRKFKISFSGCHDSACGLGYMHDMGFIARTRQAEDGSTLRGFTVLVGGGLGAVPHKAKVYSEFVEAEEIFPLSQAICRVFARLGEKKNRARARLKFLVAKLGFEEFQRLVIEERALISHDESWATLLENTPLADETPPLDASILETPAPGKGPSNALVSLGKALPKGFSDWRSTNVAPQRQAGYALVTVSLPLGDASASQGRALANLARHFTGGHLRTTVEQNFVLRWVRETDLPALFEQLQQIGLGEPGGTSIIDITSCPGTDTCKLGISSSRGLSAELRRRIEQRSYLSDEAVKGLRIKVSGCFNSCGQHHVADIGFYGVSRKRDNHAVPHFQVVLGGQWKENAGSFGLAVVAIPSKSIPDALDRILDFYTSRRLPGESFQACIQRLGKSEVRGVLQSLTTVPNYADDRSFYSDWGDPREYTLGDMGIGECAGEVVSSADFGLAESERVVYEAQLQLDRSAPLRAADMALSAMLTAAQAVTGVVRPGAADQPAEIVGHFRTELVDTKLFYDPFAGAKFANFLLQAHETPLRDPSPDAARQRIEEAQLFIEAAHACYGRLSAAEGRAAALPPTTTASN